MCEDTSVLLFKFLLWDPMRGFGLLSEKQLSKLKSGKAVLMRTEKGRDKHSRDRWNHHKEWFVKHGI